MASLGDADHLAKESLRSSVGQKTTAVGREHTMVKDLVIPIQANKPAEQYVEPNLLAKRSLAFDAVESLQQQSAKQNLGRNPRLAQMAVLRLPNRVQRLPRLIGNGTDLLERVVLWDETVDRSRAEQLSLRRFASLHTQKTN